MKKFLQSKALTWILVAAVVVVGLWKFGVVDSVGQSWTVKAAVDDMLHNRDPRRASMQLSEVHDRALVVGALKEALEADEGTVLGKMQIIQTLRAWKEPRAARRAIEGTNSKATQRAAAWEFHGDTALAEKTKPIVLEWLSDESASSREYAAILAAKLKLEDAVPVMMKALEKRPGPEDRAFIGAVLEQLVSFNPDGLAKRAMELAQDKDLDVMMRAKAFDVIGRLKDTPQDEVQSMMVTMIQDKSAHELLRKKAASVLGRDSFANDQVFDALEKVLLEPNDDHVLQRTCLWSLAKYVPLERVKRLLLDRRIYKHPFYGIRIDVAVGLAAMNVRERAVLDIMCDYMVDEDPKDLDLLLPREAWLTFWTLTGQAHGVRESRLFLNPPPPIRNEADIRRYMFRASHLRAGVTATMAESVEGLVTLNQREYQIGLRERRPVQRVRNLEQLKKVRRTCQENINAALDRWEAQAKKKDEKPDDKVEPQGPPAPGNGGK